MFSLHIESDGTSTGTKITDKHGNQIPGVTDATLFMSAGGEPTRLSLDILMPTVAVDGMVDEIIWSCPVCDERLEHKCHGNTLGGKG